jgi:hypothetical protein
VAGSRRATCTSGDNVKTYTINEACFQIPEGWGDSSVNVFSPSGKLPGDLSFVISRDGLEDGQELASYVDGQLGELSATLSQYRLIRKSEMTVDGLPAVSAEFTWNVQEKAMAQRQTYVATGRQVLVMTATTIDKFSREYNLIVDRILSSFRMSV